MTSTSFLTKHIKSPVARKLLRSPHFIMGGILTLAIVVCALFAPLIAPHDPYFQDYSAVLLPPASEGHLLGTDQFGRDILSRLVYGARVSLLVGVTSVLAGLAMGVFLGLIAGYFPRLDRLIMGFVDILIAFPGILLAIAIVAALGTGLVNVIIAIAIFSVPTFARITRGSVLSIREVEYVAAAQALGSSHSRVLTKTILPNIVSPIIIYGSLRLATSILTAATLSFLGLGAQPPIPEWGAMINEGKTYLYTARYISIAPGLAIFLSVLAFNLLGDGLRDALDPRNRP